MRILWVTPGFAADEQDHNCIPPLQALARELVRQGVDLQIVALEYPFRSKPYQWQGATIFPCNGQNRIWLKPRTLWRAMRFCHDILNTETAAIHSFWLGWAFGVGEKISQRRTVRHFTTLMGQDVLPKNRRFLKMLTANQSARLVAVSNFQNDIFEKNTGLRAAHIIHWGVEEIESSSNGQRTIDVMGAGSLLPVKNWKKWLKTIALAAQTHPNLKAELIGEGPERVRLEQLARRLGLQKIVHFTGILPRLEVLERMRRTKVLLHTADFESFGYVLAEAAVCGCRVVSTPAGVAPVLGMVAENEVDLATWVLDGIQQAAPAQPFMLFDMRDTAKTYLRLYAQDG